jgi:hypothetical protein
VRGLAQRFGRHRDTRLLFDLAGRRLDCGFALLDVPAERDDLAGAEAGLLMPEQNLGLPVAAGPGQQVCVSATRSLSPTASLAGSERQVSLDPL